MPTHPHLPTHCTHENLYRIPLLLRSYLDNTGADLCIAKRYPWDLEF